MVTKPIRLDQHSRRKMILDAARIVSERDGPLMVTLEAVAKECSIPTSESTIRRYFLTMKELRDAL